MAYERQTIKTIIDWRNLPYARSMWETEIEQRYNLWEALTAYIQSSGGWVISLPGTKHLRVEVPQNSALPAKLSEFGYKVRHFGSGTRPSPTVDTSEAVFLPVDIIEITLPGK
jgi:hypothetical protein